MYLAIALILLGFAISTLSLLAFIVLAAFLLFLDRMATYEEHDLTQILGQQYPITKSPKVATDKEKIAFLLYIREGEVTLRQVGQL